MDIIGHLSDRYLHSVIPSCTDSYRNYFLIQKKLLIMASIVIAYDLDKIWDRFLKDYNIRHDTIVGDDRKFILYYENDHHLMHISFQFGRYFELQMQKLIHNV